MEGNDRRKIPEFIQFSPSGRFLIAKDPRTGYFLLYQLEQPSSYTTLPRAIRAMRETETAATA